MVRISPVEHRLLAYVTRPGADLSVSAIAAAAGIRTRANVSSALRRLRERGLVVVDYESPPGGGGRRYRSIRPTFRFERGHPDGYRVSPMPDRAERAVRRAGR